MKIQTLAEFYTLMRQSRNDRQQLTNMHFNKEHIAPEDIQPLEKALTALKNINTRDNQYHLELTEDKTIALDLSYEMNELEKDIFFLTHSPEEFYAYLESLHPDFSAEVNAGLERLKDISFRNFITDRDGTVNNYCGRYASSIQSIYNAVFLTRFAQKVNNAVILTSAPLDNIGLVDISVSPDNIFIYAGSKGREYFDKQGQRHQFPVEPDKQSKLDIFNQQLTDLVKQPEYEMFTLIGSGLQFKFGQTTIARQDISKTIPAQESEDFLNLITNIVQKIDPQKKYFRIEDTGKDIEVILTIENADESGELKDFDKGDAVDFLNKDLHLQLAQGPNLICGDTKSDVPMVPAAMAHSQDTWAVFVTEDPELKTLVQNTCPNTLIVSRPDVLVMILNKKQ